ncbi:MAG: hypothetical protein V1495_04770 [Pseudomonadota bacterium]
MTRMRGSQLFLVTLSFLAGCGIAGSVKKHEAAVTSTPLPRLILERFGGDQQNDRVGRTLPSPLTVRVCDESGIPYSEQTVHFEIVSGDASFVGESVVMTDVEGTTSAQLQFGTQASSVSVVAKLAVPEFDETKHQVTFQATSVIPPPPRLLIADDRANGQTGAVNTDLPYPLSVIALDEDGHPVKDQTVQFTVVRGGADIKIPREITTDADGRASPTLTLGKGAAELEVQATWLPDAENDPNRHVIFTAKALPGVPSLLTFLSGTVNGTSPPCTGEGEEFADPLVLRLTDPYGNAIAGQSLTIAPDARSGVSGHPLNTAVPMNTNDAGQVSFRLTAGSVGGNSYDASTTIRASTSLPDGTPGPSISAPLVFTKHLFLTLESELYNYGSTSFDLIRFQFFFKFPVNISADERCWAPAPNLTIHGTYSQSWGQCPANVTSWSSETTTGDILTDGSGNGSGVATFSVEFMPTSDPIASRLTLSADGSNTLYVYAGPPACE